MGLDYFGCDLDEDYVDFMKSRIGKEEVWEKNLFDFENKNEFKEKLKLKNYSNKEKKIKVKSTTIS